MCVLLLMTNGFMSCTMWWGGKTPTAAAVLALEYHHHRVSVLLHHIWIAGFANWEHFSLVFVAESLDSYVLLFGIVLYFFIFSSNEMLLEEAIWSHAVSQSLQLVDMWSNSHQRLFYSFTLFWQRTSLTIKKWLNNQCGASLRPRSQSKCLLLWLRDQPDCRFGVSVLAELRGEAMNHLPSALRAFQSLCTMAATEAPISFTRSNYKHLIHKSITTSSVGWQNG